MHLCGKPDAGCRFTDFFCGLLVVADRLFEKSFFDGEMLFQMLNFKQCHAYSPFPFSLSRIAS